MFEEGCPQTLTSVTWQPVCCIYTDEYTGALASHTQREKLRESLPFFLAC